jgi:hypothetical protein
MVIINSEYNTSDNFIDYVHFDIHYVVLIDNSTHPCAAAPNVCCKAEASFAIPIITIPIAEIIIFYSLN